MTRSYCTVGGPKPRRGRHIAGAKPPKSRKVKMFQLPSGQSIPWEQTSMAKVERERRAARGAERVNRTG